jgi:acetoin utilization protein AcuB
MRLPDIRQGPRHFVDFVAPLLEIAGLSARIFLVIRRALCVSWSWRTVMQVQDVMTTKVLTVDAHDTIARARARMRHMGVHQLVVTAERAGVVGVIGVADVRNAPDVGCVEDFMSRCLFIVRRDTSVGAAAALMRAHAIGSLPVLDGRRLVGIVTVSDMLDVVDNTDGALTSV